MESRNASKRATMSAVAAAKGKRDTSSLAQANAVQTGCRRSTRIASWGSGRSKSD